MCNLKKRHLIMIKKFLIIFFFSCGLLSCMIDRIPQIHLSIKTNDNLSIDSILFASQNDSLFKQGYEINIINGGDQVFWLTGTFKVIIFPHNKLPIKSNIVTSETDNDYFDLLIDKDKVRLIKIKESIITKWIFYLFLMFFVSFGFKTLPSVAFIKPLNKDRYLIYSTLLNFGYCIFIIGGAKLVNQFKPTDIVATGILLICISFLVDTVIYTFKYSKRIKFFRLISCILLTNILFYGGGLLIFVLISLMS